MKNILPDININLALRTIRVSQLFSRSSKPPPPPPYETPESNYEFLCPCTENYVGQTRRPLFHQIRNHCQNSKGKEIYKHIHTCDMSAI